MPQIVFNKYYICTYLWYEHSCIITGMIVSRKKGRNNNKKIKSQKLPACLKRSILLMYFLIIIFLSSWLSFSLFVLSEFFVPMFDIIYFIFHPFSDHRYVWSYTQYLLFCLVKTRIRALFGLESLTSFQRRSFDHQSSCKLSKVFL